MRLHQFVTQLATTLVPPSPPNVVYERVTKSGSAFYATV